MMIKTTRIGHGLYSHLLRVSINSIYHEEDRFSRLVPPYLKDCLIDVLIQGNYKPFSDISYYIINESEIPEFIYNLVKMESLRGHLWLEDNPPFGIAMYQLNNEQDLLVMKGLSQVLLNTLIWDPPNVNKLSDLKDHHYAFLNRQKRVLNIVKIDLSPCIKHIDKFRMLDCFQTLRDYPVIYDLIKVFMDLKIYDKDGNPFNTQGIPPLGELTNVLFHIFYQYAFDMAIEERYPGISYTRWGHQVFIVLKEEHNFLISDNETNTFLLEELNLAGNIERINYASHSYLVGTEEDKIVFIDEDGDVEVCGIEDV